MIPIPHSRAKAIARRDSVTVSMAALTIGILMTMRRVRCVRVSVSVGRTEDFPGSNSTSSKVRPNGTEDCNMSAPLLFRRRPQLRARGVGADGLFLQQNRGF